MDRLWSPWRYQYVTNTNQTAECIFCLLAQRHTDEADYILYRGKLNYIVLNTYPYTNGHLLIVPLNHMALLTDATKESSDELMELTKECQSMLAKEYHPHGFNLGMNLGRAAGAGVAEHFHMHIMPRWFGDINFTTTVGETRVLPETLENTYQRLKRYFQSP